MQCDGIQNTCSNGKDVSFSCPRYCNNLNHGKRCDSEMRDSSVCIGRCLVGQIPKAQVIILKEHKEENVNHQVNLMLSDVCPQVVASDENEVCDSKVKFDHALNADDEPFIPPKGMQQTLSDQIVQITFNHKLNKNVQFKMVCNIDGFQLKSELLTLKIRQSQTRKRKLRKRRQLGTCTVPWTVNSGFDTTIVKPWTGSSAVGVQGLVQTTMFHDCQTAGNCDPSDTIDCNLYSAQCYMYKPDCSTKINNGLQPERYVTLDGKCQNGNSCNLEWEQDIAAGYTVNTCFYCEDTSHNMYISMQLTITVLSLCESKGYTSTIPSDLTVTYDSLLTSVQAMAGWTSFMTNDNTADGCVNPNNCILLQSDDSPLTSIQQTWITIGSSSPWSVNINRAIDLGWSLTVKYKCTSTQNTQGTAVSWTVTQSPNCADNIQLKSSLPSSSSIIPYSASGPGYITLFTTYLDVFQLTKEPQCGTPSSCVLMTSGCSNTNGLPQYIDIGTTSPWAVKQYNNIPAGYDIIRCLKCLSADQPSGVTFDNIQLKQIRDCTNHIVAATSQVSSPITQFYDQSVTSQSIISSWTDVFQNQYEADCGAVTSCEIYAGDCTSTTPYSDSKLTFGSSPSFSLSMDRSDILGWSTQICYKCSSSSQTASKLYDIQLVSCAHDIQVKSTAPSTTSILNYQNTSTKLTLGDSTTIFDKSTISLCTDSISSCSLYEQDCSTSLSSSKTPELVEIESTSPWAISQKQNAADGYAAFQVCYKCVSSLDVDGNNIIMTLSQNADCTTNLENADNQRSNSIILPYTGSTQILATGYDDQIFKVNKPSVCNSPDIASLKQNDCSTALTSAQQTQIQMSNTSPWQLTANLDIATGWSQTICYSVGVSSPQMSFISFIWTITQYDCSQNFEVKTLSNSPIAIEYLESTETKQLFSGWTEFFSNKAPQYCPDPDTCILKESDCTQSFDGTLIVIDGSSPWQVSAKQNEQSSWQKSFCVVCSSSAQTIQSNPINVEQSYEISITPENETSSVVNCSQHLSAHPDQKGSFLVLPYNDSMYTILSKWNDKIFQNSDPDNCGQVTKCELLQQNCQDALLAYQNEIIQIYPQESWSVKVNQSIPQGWNINVCYKCFSSKMPQGITFNWNLQLVDCSNSLQLEDPSFKTEEYHSYRKSPQFKTIYNKDEVFVNSNPVQCPPINDCDLYEKDCTSKYEGERFSIDKLDNYNVQVQQNSDTQWNETICFKCQSKASSITMIQNHVQLAKTTLFTPQFNQSIAISPNVTKKNETIEKETPILSNQKKVVKNDEFNVMLIRQQEIKKEQKEQDDKFNPQDFKYFTCRIDEITANGIVKLKFSEEMQDQYYGVTPEMIDHSVLQVIIMNNDIILSSWKVQEYSGMNLIIQLNISNPLVVSQKKRDNLLVQIIKPSIFKTQGHGFVLTESSKIMIAPIQKQLKNDLASKVLEASATQINNGMNSILTMQAALHFLITISLSQILIMFHPLQIMVFESMLMLQYPANATFLSNAISKIINLDVLDPDFIGKKLLNFSLEDVIEKDPFYSMDNYKNNILIAQIQDQGYETYHPILNLGGIFIVMGIFVNQVIFVGLLILVVKIHQRCQSQSKLQKEGGVAERKNISWRSRLSNMLIRYARRKSKVLVRQIFFTNFIVVISESALQLFMSVWLFFYNYNVQDLSKKNSLHPIFDAFTWFTVGYCIISLFFLMAFAILVVIKKKETLFMKDFRNKFGYLYEDLEKDSKLALSYYLIFIVRRLLLCIIFLHMQSAPTQQIQCLLFINLIIFIYIGNIEPHRFKYDDTIELVNELLIVMLSLQFVIFTDYVGSYERKYDVGGNLYIFFMITCICFNGFFVVKDTVKYLYLCCIKYFRIAQSKYFKNKINKKILQEKKRMIEGSKSENTILEYPQIFLIPDSDNEEFDHKRVINQNEIIYKNNKVKLFELRRAIELQQQRIIFYCNPKGYEFWWLIGSKLSSQEKVKIFFEIKIALHIMKKYEAQQKEDNELNLINFVNSFIKDEIPQKYSKDPEFIKTELSWLKIRKQIENKKQEDLVNEQVKGYQLFELQYHKNLCWNMENDTLTLQIPQEGFQDFWTQGEINSLLKWKSDLRRNYLYKLYQNSKSKQEAMRKVQQLYLTINEYQLSQISQLNMKLNLLKRQYNDNEYSIILHQLKQKHSFEICQTVYRI